MEFGRGSCELERDGVILFVVNYCYLVAVDGSDRVSIIIYNHIETTVRRRCDCWYMHIVQDFDNDVGDGAFVVLDEGGVDCNHSAWVVGLYGHR